MNNEHVPTGFPIPKAQQDPVEASMSLCISRVGLLQIRTSITESPVQAHLFEEYRKFSDFLSGADSIHRLDTGSLWYFRSVKVPYAMFREWLRRAEPTEYRLIVVAKSDPASVSKDAGAWDPNPWNLRRKVTIEPAFDTASDTASDHVRTRKDTILAKASASTNEHLRVQPDSDQVEITESGAWVPVKIFVTNADLEKE